MIHQVCIHGSHQMETVSIQVIPHFFVDGPQVFLIHHFPEYFYCRKSRCAIFRIKAIYTTPSWRSCIFIMLHRIHLFVRAAIMYSGTLRLHLISACTIQLIQQFGSTGHFCAFIGSNVVSQRRMITNTLHCRLHVTHIESLVMRMTSIPCHPEFLPYQQTQFITKLEEIVRFGNTTSPHTQKVDPRLAGIAQFSIRTFIRVSQHSFRYPVRTTDKQSFAIYIKDT